MIRQPHLLFEFIYSFLHNKKLKSDNRYCCSLIFRIKATFNAIIMSTIKVYTATELVAAFEKNTQNGVLIIEPKKEAPNKRVGAVKYLNAYFNMGDGNTSRKKSEGWFSFENVELSIGVADPSNKEDSRNQFEGTRLSLQTTVSRAGALGRALQLVDAGWKNEIKKLIDNGTIVIGNRSIHDVVQFNYSMEHKTNPGGVIEDPIIRLKIDFKPFPQKYKYQFLVGQPKTQFFDYTKPYQDKEGRTQYRPAEVLNPATGIVELVGEGNLHHFVTNGSTIMHGRITIPSGAISQAWVSLPIMLTKVVLKPGGPEGFSDEIFTPIERFSDASFTLPIVTAAPTITTADLLVNTEEKKDPASAEAPVPSLDDITKLLSNM
jgi:hypothetical protein